MEVITEQEQVITFLATSKPFQKWLETFKPDEIVGLAGSCVNCPIARFVSQKSSAARSFAGAKFVRQQGTKLQVLPDMLIVGYGSTAISTADLPSLQWVADFVKLVDTTNISDTITSATALKVLERLNPT